MNDRRLRGCGYLQLRANQKLACFACGISKYSIMNSLTGMTFVFVQIETPQRTVPGGMRNLNVWSEGCVVVIFFMFIIFNRYSEVGRNV